GEAGPGRIVAGNQGEGGDGGEEIENRAVGNRVFPEHARERHMALPKFGDVARQAVHAVLRTTGFSRTPRPVISTLSGPPNFVTSAVWRLRRAPPGRKAVPMAMTSPGQREWKRVMKASASGTGYL